MHGVLDVLSAKTTYMFKSKGKSLNYPFILFFFLLDLGITAVFVPFLVKKTKNYDGLRKIFDIIMFLY